MGEEEPLSAHCKWVLENERAIAERSHDQAWSFAQKSNEAAVQGGNAALKSMLLINGGAAITVLAFVGNLIGKSTDGLAPRLIDLMLSLEWFGWGVALSAAGTGFAYITNYAISADAARRIYSYKHPYVRNTPEAKRWRIAGIAFNILAIATGFGSLVVFLIGIASVRAAILAAPIN